MAKRKSQTRRRNKKAGFLPPAHPAGAPAATGAPSPVPGAPVGAPVGAPGASVGAPSRPLLESSLGSGILQPPSPSVPAQTKQRTGEEIDFVKELDAFDNGQLLKIFQERFKDNMNDFVEYLIGKFSTDDNLKHSYKTLEFITALNTKMMDVFELKPSLAGNFIKLYKSKLHSKGGRRRTKRRQNKGGKKSKKNKKRQSKGGKKSNKRSNKRSKRRH